MFCEVSFLLQISVIYRACLNLFPLMKTGVERVTPDLHPLAAEGSAIGATAGAVAGATGMDMFWKFAYFLLLISMA
jgi:hypothetical protein